MSYKIDGTTQASAVDYTWFTEEKRSIGIPEGKLSISCGTPCAVCPTVETNQPIAPAKSAENMSAIKSQPGFEALLAAIGLFAAGLYMRRKT